MAEGSKGIVMNTYIALLRGINVSGQKLIRMADLNSLCASIGFVNVDTYLQSGNVLFEHSAENVAILTDKLTTAIENQYGFSVAVWVELPEVFDQLLRENPFGTPPDKDTAGLYVTFLAREPDDEALELLKQTGSQGEELRAAGRYLYLHFENGYGRAKLNNNYIEKKLQMPATTRNWKTVNALYTMAGER